MQQIFQMRILCWADFRVRAFLGRPRKIDDSRNVLYKHYVRIVKEKKPLMFVGENVKGLLTMGGGTIIEAIVEDFSQCGYNVFYKLLNAKDYAVPRRQGASDYCRI